jgi:hypothetical protein
MRSTDPPRRYVADKKLEDIVQVFIRFLEGASGA